MDKTEGSIELGGSIELVGFKDLSGSDMVIVKKIVGNHVKRITEISKDFKSIKITLKIVHETEKSKKFEIHVSLMAEKQHNAETTERNLYFGIDNVLKKIINNLG